MQEVFLHYIWQYQKLISPLNTVCGAQVEVKHAGMANTNSGPDFFNAQIFIDDQLWAGNVEIHVNSSDWYVHHHEKDKAYDNVILHVVWEHDTEIFRSNNSKIPTLVLKQHISDQILNNYQSLIGNTTTWINCEKSFAEVDKFILDNWLERLCIERLEEKSEQIIRFLEATNNDWEAVLFTLLFKNFGLKVNGEAFMSIANSFDFNVVRKLHAEASQLEALFFGQAGLLNDTIEDVYYDQLKSDYNYIKHKFSLSAKGVLPVRFFRLRPYNFPTVRLSQLACLYAKHQSLFSRCVKAETLKDIYTIFEIEASDYWTHHFTFGTTSKALRKKVSKAFTQLLIINTIIPVKFTYSKSIGVDNDHLLEIMKALTVEKNSIVERFFAIRSMDKNASISQALIQLKKKYCDANKCIQCAVGNRLILKN